MRKRNGTYFEVKLLITPVVVSNCTANANIPAIPAKVYQTTYSNEGEGADSPTPESKSGTIAARVMMIKCSSFRRLVHYVEKRNTFKFNSASSQYGHLGLTFWGSAGSSEGCGHSTLVPSGESLRRDATFSPNSMRASL